MSVASAPVFSLLALISSAYTYGYGLNEIWLQGSKAAEYVFPSKVKHVNLHHITTESDQNQLQFTKVTLI